MHDDQWVIKAGQWIEEGSGMTGEVVGVMGQWRDGRSRMTIGGVRTSGEVMEGAR